jgi:hypothetical protein
MKRVLFLAAIAAVALSASAVKPPPITISDFGIVLPAGWQLTSREPERLTFRTSRGGQQATITVLPFKARPSFSDFKRLCEHRLAAEHRAANVFVEPSEPFDHLGKFGFFFSGGEKANGRLFSGYLLVGKRDLATLYMESFGVSPKEHLQSFATLVEHLKTLP